MAVFQFFFKRTAYYELTIQAPDIRAAKKACKHALMPDCTAIGEDGLEFSGGEVFSEGNLATEWAPEGWQEVDPASATIEYTVDDKGRFHCGS